MSRARTVALFLFALGLLGLGWSLTPRTAPPVFDGVGFPDEPYRFVVKPAGAADTKAPTTATGSAAVSEGTVGAIHASSAEQAPQVNILVPIGRLHAPSGTTRVVVNATPVRPQAPPEHAYLWSNVYDIEAPGGSITLSDASPLATITLRAATGQRPLPTIERYADGGWTKLETVPAGSDVYQAPLPALGRYAVIGSTKLGGGKAPASKTGIIVSVVAVIVVIGLFVIGARRRSKVRKDDAAARGSPPDDPPVIADSR